jgi:hypothetical protein
MLPAVAAQGAELLMSGVRMAAPDNMMAVAVGVACEIAENLSKPSTDWSTSVKILGSL